MNVPKLTPQNTSDSDSLYDRVVQHVFFSGTLAPGDKVVERRLADDLGVSRIPIREALRQLAGQGLLVMDQNGQGARLRNYTAEDIRQLYELRELLEGGAARAAAKAATDTDIARMVMICEQSEKELDHPNSQVWADLDHAFHAAIADASHNERIARSLKQLLTECHSVFYTSGNSRPPASSNVKTQRQAVLNDHLELLRLIRTGEPELAEEKARLDMRLSSDRYVKAMIARDIAGGY